MRVLVAGASGVVGRRLVPLLVAAGHTVTGTSRTNAGAAAIAATGAAGVIMDALDASSVTRVVRDATPAVVIHQLTAIGSINLKHVDRGFALTNRLRTEGLDHLLRAAMEVGSRRFIAQSFTGWTNPRTGGPVKSETDPLDPHPIPGSEQTLAAIASLETSVADATGVDGVVLRYGNLYGPGTSLGLGGELYDMIATRRLPIVGRGSGIWSFVHVEDAAAAAVQALDHGEPGLYNVVDDDPAPVSLWLPYLAAAIGAKRPLRIPTWVARPLIGELGVQFMTGIRGASNTKAMHDLDWEPPIPELAPRFHRRSVNAALGTWPHPNRETSATVS